MLPLEYHEGLVGTAPSQSREDQGYDADLEDSDGAHMTSFRPPNAQHAIASTARRRSSGPIIEISVPVDYVAIDDDDDDAEEPALLDDEDCVLLDILPDTSETGAAAQASVNHHSTKTLTSWLIDGNECKGVVTKGVCVELANGEFLIIDQILQDLTTEIHLTGTRLVRALKLDSFLSNKLNEVVMMRDYLEQRSGIRQPKGPHVVNLASVLHVRDLVRTNAVFPKFSYRSHHSPEVLARQKHRWHEHYSQLTCRWEFSSVWKPKKHRPSEFTIKVLDQRDCGEEYFIPPAELRYDWRGDTIPGGSSLEIDDRPWQTPKTSASHGKLPGARRSSTIQQAAERIQLAERSSPRSSISGSSHTAAPSPQLSIRRMPPHTLPPSRGLPTIEQQRVYEDLNTRGRDLFLSSAGSSSRCPSGAPPVLRGDAATIEVSPHLPSPVAAKTANQRYTFGDGFCGAGGVSRGAKAAGVRLSWAFDKDERASGAYAINFPESWTYFEDVHSFLHIQDNKKVDIMHLSPPCQTFSPAHTIAGKDDDANEAALFSVEDLIKAARPRLFSLEQTFGITWESNKKFFNNLIRQLLDQGYSTRWGLVQCLDYGGPKRTRLIIFAACSGEKLPMFPRPTHSSGGRTRGTVPYKTIRQSLEGITDMTPNHNFKEPFRRVLQPFSPDQPLDITITCNGGIGNYHHSGLRPYTNREFASLSGFPVIHYFGDVGEIRLIGNAVPPPVSEALTRTLIEALEKEDGFEGRSARRRRQKSFVEPPVRGRSSGSVPHTPVRKSSVRPIDLTLGEPPVISPWRQSPVHRIRPLQAESSTFPPTPQSTHSFPTLADRSRSSGHSDRPIDLVTDDRPSSSPFRQLIQQRRNGTQGTGVIPFPSTPRNIRNASSWVDDSPSAGRSLRGRGSATKRKLSIIEVDD